MRIIVDKDNVNIVNKPILHKGEYGVHKCEFEFSKEYDNLVKIAVFRQENTYETYKVDVIDNMCDIPSEVLERAGYVFLGLYAYTNEDEVLKLRYSPKNDDLFVYQGSYTSNGKTPTEVTPSQYEMYSKALNDGLGKLEEALSKLEEYEPSGGGSGTSNYSELENKPSINNVELIGNKTLEELGIQKKGDFLTEIPENFVTEEMLENKGYSTFTGDYNDLSNKPTIPVVPTNVGAFTNDAGYLTEHQDISGKADKKYVDDAISNIDTGASLEEVQTLIDNAIGTALGGEY